MVTIGTGIPVTFTGAITKFDNGLIRVYVCRSDGRYNYYDIPEKKLSVFRAIDVRLNRAIGFLLGET